MHTPTSSHVSTPSASPELTAAGKPRLDTRAFLREVGDEFFSFDRGLPFTLTQLLWRPGWTIRRYVVERDPRLTRPVRMLLICLALAALALHGIEFARGFSQGFASGIEPGDADAMQAVLLSWLGHFDLMLLLCWIPAVAAALQRGYPIAQHNLAEAFAFGSYSLALLLLLSLPLRWLPEPATLPWLVVMLIWPLLAPAYGYHRPAGGSLLRALGFALLALVLAAMMLFALLLAAIASVVIGG